MNFVLFTEKSVNECMKDLHERLQAKSRYNLDGWFEKNGRFSISVTTNVIGRFPRQTRLTATAAKEDGITVIRGFVPHGLPRERVLLVLGTVFALAVYMFLQGQVIIALGVLVGGGFLGVPLWGDYRNHDVLLAELEKTLKARPNPPKSSAGDKKAAIKKSSAKPVTSANKPLVAAKKPITASARPNAPKDGQKSAPSR